MTPYNQLVRRLVEDDTTRQDRTETGTWSCFGPQLKFDLTSSFPAVTAKKLQWSSVMEELLWMIRGHTSTDLLENGIWDDWADENNDLGPVYGHQWRYWGDDQLQTMVDTLREAPYSRRMLVSSWNVDDLDDMALPPCHLLFQAYRDQDGGVRLKVYQRSADVFLGLPFNIAGYAALTHILATLVGGEPREMILSLGDAHLYANHESQAETYLERLPGPPQPTFEMPHVDTLGDVEALSADDFKLHDYSPEPFLPAPVAV